MPTMVARDLKSYAGKPLKPGQKFEVEDEKHVRTLTLSRKAELVEVEDSKRRYRRRDITAE